MWVLRARARAKSQQDTINTNVRVKRSSAHVKDDNLSVKMMFTHWGLYSNCLQYKRLSTQKLSLFVSLMWRSPQICTVCYSAQCVLCSVRCLCIFYDPVSNTIRRRCGYRGIFREEGVDTRAYFKGNHGSRVGKSQKCGKLYFPHTRTSWDKRLFNGIRKPKF